MRVVRVHHGVALAAGDHRPVDRIGDGARDEQREREAPPERTVVRPASIAPGTRSMIALSTTSITAIETVSEASASGTAAARAMPERSSGSIVSE